MSRPIAIVPSSVTRAVATLLAFAALALGADARATIYACPTPSGGTQFQDRPCARAAAASTGAPVARSRAPVGLHASWFVRPPGSDVVARCDDDGCRCDALDRPFESGLALAVADALYVDGAWHRLENAVAERAANAPDGPPPETLDRLVDEAACDVLISQRILRAHASGVLADLRRRARETEERGFDDGIACAAGDAVACEAEDALALYRRMVTDLVALRAPRERDADDAPTESVSAADRASR